MKAVVLVKKGKPEVAFELRDVEKPSPKPNEVLIKSEAFGLNYADVMARLGLYEDCPPLPAVIGYDMIGRIESIGSEITEVAVGDRVVALTRFGGYAEYAVTDGRAVAKVPDDMSVGVGTALTTQYGTAYYAGEEMVRIHEGDHVLIQAAAGGVGTALVQLAKHRGATVYGTASTHKLDYLREMGVDHPIDYRNTDFETAVRKIRGKEGIDVAFDSIGGKHVKKAFKLLGSGGRLVCYGAASMSDTVNNRIKLLGVAFGFGLYSPIQFLKPSKGVIGVNMLRIADDRPDTLNRCLKGVVKLVEEGVFNPTVGGVYKVDQINEAHSLLESRKSMGKIVVEW